MSQNFDPYQAPEALINEPAPVGEIPQRRFRWLIIPMSLSALFGVFIPALFAVGLVQLEPRITYTRSDMSVPINLRQERFIRN